jgi:hypothetical protein
MDIPFPETKRFERQSANLAMFKNRESAHSNNWAATETRFFSPSAELANLTPTADRIPQDSRCMTSTLAVNPIAGQSCFAKLWSPSYNMPIRQSW